MTEKASTPIDHKTRAHSVWSASATSRNVCCAGAIAMETLCEGRETEAAAWGTAGHEVAEACLRGSVDAVSFLGDTKKIGKFEFVVDEEMANTAQTYVDYCRSIVERDGFGDCCWIEQRLSLASLEPPLESGGTADFVAWLPHLKTLEVVDLKCGRGVTVDVKGNPQGRTYAIGALLAFPELPVKRIKVTIVQPRVGDGKPKSEEFHTSDLLDWTVDLLAAMNKSKQALDEFGALNGNRVAFDDWAERWLTTGQCTFCNAKAICPKMRTEALAVAGETARKWFEEPSEGPLVVGNAPSLASPEELAHWLDGLDMLEGWIKSIRAYAHAEAEKGVSLPGYRLVDKIGVRAWIDETKTSEALLALGLSTKQVFEESIRSPAQIEKIIGAKRKGEIETLVHRPARGTNLTSESKTTRPAAKTKAEQHHESLEN